MAVIGRKFPSRARETAARAGSLQPELRTNNMKEKFAKAGSRSQYIEAQTPMDTYLKAKEAFDKAKDALEILKADVIETAREAWLTFNRNQSEPLSTVRFPGDVKVTFAATYSKPELLPEDLRKTELAFKLDDSALDEEASGKWYADFAKLRKDFEGTAAEIRLDVTAVTDADAFMARLLKLRDKHVGLVVRIDEKQVPVENFAVRRHRDLTPAQNLELEEKGLGTKVSVR